MPDRAGNGADLRHARGAGLRVRFAGAKETKIGHVGVVVAVARGRARHRGGAVGVVAALAAAHAKAKPMMPLSTPNAKEALLDRGIAVR
jgi:hypothetical protein